jgi:hypothetical protein
MRRHGEAQSHLTIVITLANERYHRKGQQFTMCGAKHGDPRAHEVGATNVLNVREHPYTEATELHIISYSSEL